MNEAIDRLLSERQRLDRGLPATALASLAAHLGLAGLGLGLPLLLPQEPPLKVAPGFAVVLPRGGGGSAVVAPPAAGPAPQPAPVVGAPPPPPGDLDILRAGDSYSTFYRASGDNIRNHASLGLDVQLTPKVGLGFGYDNASLAEHRHPNRDDLDQISKDIPVLLWHQSGHMVAVNSKALELTGMTAETPDPAGGVILRRSGSKEPNGCSRKPPPCRC